MNSFKLLNGEEMPMIGLGTFKGKKEEIQKAVEHAIDVGYRMIDTAFMYLNEDYIGQGIKNKIDEGVIKREDIFVVTKLHATHVHTPQLIEQNLRTSLARLQLTYVDLWLMHSPLGMKTPTDNSEVFPTNKETGEVAWDYSTNIIDTWKGMELMVKKGLTRGIGVSNFSIKQMERIQQIATVPLCAQQIECHPYFLREKQAEFCKKHQIAFMAYGPIGAPYIADRLGLKQLLKDDLVLNLASKYKKTPAQVILRFLIQLDRIVIPKSVTPSRIAENFQVFDFNISEEDVEAMQKLNRNENLFFRADGDFARGASQHPEWQIFDDQ